MEAMNIKSWTLEIIFIVVLDTNKDLQPVLRETSR